MGYIVRVYDAMDWHENARVLHELKFPWPPGNALRDAEKYAQRMDREYPGHYVEVDCIWAE